MAFLFWRSVSHFGKFRLERRCSACLPSKPKRLVRQGFPALLKQPPFKTACWQIL